MESGRPRHGTPVMKDLEEPLLASSIYVEINSGALSRFLARSMTDV